MYTPKAWKVYTNEPQISKNEVKNPTIKKYQIYKNICTARLKPTLLPKYAHLN